MKDGEEKDGINQRRSSIYYVIYIFIGLFALMMGYFTWFLAAKKGEVINSTYNKRHDVLAERVTRGKILAADGTVLAETVLDEEGKEVRRYPFDDMYAHVVGRVDKGRTGIEETENIRLLTSSRQSIGAMYNDLIGEKNPGDNVITTLDPKLTEIAYDALGNNRGAVVVMEPSTGKLLAMVSKPSYDPNKINNTWEELMKEEEDSKSPLLNRASQGLYPPGSTFKLLTALEYIRENPDYLQYEYNCNGRTDYENMVIHCYNNRAHGKVDLKKSLAKSCNTSFATMGKSLDVSNFYKLCEEFMFNQALPANIGHTPSRFELKAGSYSIKEAMQTAIGQGRTLMSPLHNAMIASAIANRGIMMKPYVVDRIESAGGRIIKGFHPEEGATPMTKEEAAFLTEMMKAVVTDGTADELSGLKVAAAGKTGSAETEGNRAHAWFIGFAPAKNPEIAVSILVESKGSGSEYAVPIARKLFDAYFN